MTQSLRRRTPGGTLKIPRMVIGLLGALVICAPGRAALPDKVDYLIVAADDLYEGCGPLLEYRSRQGYATAAVKASEACGGNPLAAGAATRLAGFVKEAHERCGVRYLLLVGDARGKPGAMVPMVVAPSGYYSRQILSDPDVASDFPYATLGTDAPQLHVGRFAVDTPAELATAMDKTIAYETQEPGGSWQRRIGFVTGVLGYSPIVDALAESVFARIVTEDIAPLYDLEVAQSLAGSVYCPFPPDFSANSLRMMKTGALAMVYVGHGQWDSFDEFTWRGTRCSVLGDADIDRISCSEGLPLMVALACSTGRIDDERGECLAERMFKLARGPVAYLGASRVSQPYGIALFGKHLVGTLLGEEQQTLGEAIDEAKQAVEGDVQSGFRQQLDMLSAMVYGPQSLPGIRRDTVLQYNLLGDPALRLRRPVPLRVSAVYLGDGQIEVRGESPIRQGQVLVSLECGRAEFPRELPVVDEASRDLRSEMNRRYQQAQDKAFQRVEATAEDGRFHVVLPAAGSETSQWLIVKAAISDGKQCAAGACILRRGVAN
ncbi:C25 family cysteine peptidase [bacterium]|nr:C25 family cysteine peptidase [bacterium]